MKEAPMRLASRIACGAVAVILLASCGGGSSGQAWPSPQLDASTTCGEFSNFAIIGVRWNDAEFAYQLRLLGHESEDPSLAEALYREATAFDHHVPDPSTAEILNLCQPYSTTTTSTP
jgi:hypothetical protein